MPTATSTSATSVTACPAGGRRIGTLVGPSGCDARTCGGRRTRDATVIGGRTPKDERGSATTPPPEPSRSRGGAVAPAPRSRPPQPQRPDRHQPEGGDPERQPRLERHH